jgi:hypothetical protein
LVHGKSVIFNSTDSLAFIADYSRQSLYIGVGINDLAIRTENEKPPSSW